MAHCVGLTFTIDSELDFDYGDNSGRIAELLFKVKEQIK